MDHETTINRLQARIARLARLPQTRNVSRKMTRAYRLAGELRRMSLSLNLRD